MKCCKCERTTEHGLTLFRQNEKGVVPAIWACEACNTTPIDPELKQVVSDIQDAILEMK